MIQGYTDGPGRDWLCLAVSTVAISTVAIVTMLVLTAGVAAGTSPAYSNGAADRPAPSDTRPVDALNRGATLGASSDCSYGKTETLLAQEGHTAGVVSPHAEDDLLVLLGGFTNTEPTYNASQFEAAFFGTGTENVSGPGTLRDYYYEATGGLINLSAGPAGVRGWSVPPSRPC